MSDEAPKPPRAPLPPTTSPFSDGRVLGRIFGSEESFRLASGNELDSLVSSKLIVDFLKAKAAELAKGAAGKALQWATAELLKAFGMGGAPDDLAEIKTLLAKIVDLQEQVLRKLDDVLLEVQFQHVVTRGYESVQRITNIYERLERLSAVNNPEEREREANALRTAVLDINSGILISLRTVSDVLTGKDQLGHSDSLIKLFAARWYAAYHPRQLREDYPLSRYYGPLDEWLHELSVIQYMGVSALANARIANGDFETLEGELKAVIKQMEQQQRLMDDEVPEWARTLPRRVLEEEAGSWFNFHVFGLKPNRGPNDDGYVLYAPRYDPKAPILEQPPNLVRFGDLASPNLQPIHIWQWFIWNQQWTFEKADPQKGYLDGDAFFLRVREQGFYVTRDGDFFDPITLRMDVKRKPELRTPMRFVLGPPTDPARRSSARPIVGFVGRSDYMVVGKVLAETGVARAGAEDKALEVAIKPAVEPGA